MTKTMYNEGMRVYQVVAIIPQIVQPSQEFTTYVVAKNTDNIEEILRGHYREFVDVIAIERLCDHLIVPEDWTL